MLAFCREKNLKIFWTEWKTDHKDTNTEVFSEIQTIIEGYQDIVTVSFSTNSGEAEPYSGFLNLMKCFNIGVHQFNRGIGKHVIMMPIIKPF